jgi:hypothetical protein
MVHAGCFETPAKKRKLKKAASNSSSPETCALFPHLLDYIYHGTLDFIMTDTTVGMVYLAEYFLLPSLLQCLQTFIQKDLSLEISDKNYAEVGSYDNHTRLIHVPRISREWWKHRIISAV